MILLKTTGTLDTLLHYTCITCESLHVLYVEANTLRKFLLSHVNYNMWELLLDVFIMYLMHFNCPFVYKQY